VYGVDVGHGQVMGSIAQDPRVTVMEKTNLRHMAAGDLPEQVGRPLQGGRHTDKATVYFKRYLQLQTHVSIHP
jgi:hypothetical protein